MTTSSDHQSYDEENRLILTAPETADIEQEAQILKWLKKGKVTPNRKLIQRRLASRDGSYLLYASETDLPVNSRLMWDHPDSISESHMQDVRDRLRFWSESQPKAIQVLIREFLDQESPDQEESFPHVIRILRRRGLLAKPSISTRHLSEHQPINQSKSHSGRLTLIQLIYQAIQQSPQTIEELYRLTSTIHSARRPEAACRQALRRLMRQNLIQKTLENTYQVINNRKGE